MFLIFGHNNPILSLATTFQVLFEFYSLDWAGTGLGLSWSFCHFLHNLFERTRFEYKTGHNTAPRCLHNFYFMSPPSSPLHPTLSAASTFIFNWYNRYSGLSFHAEFDFPESCRLGLVRVRSRKCFMVIVWFYYLCGGPRPSNCNQASDRILHEWRHQQERETREISNIEMILLWMSS